MQVVNEAYWLLLAPFKYQPKIISFFVSMILIINCNAYCPHLFPPLLHLPANKVLPKRLSSLFYHILKIFSSFAYDPLKWGNLQESLNYEASYVLIDLIGKMSNIFSVFKCIHHLFKIKASQSFTNMAI